MNKTKAMNKVDLLMKKDFKYLCKKDKVNLMELHYTFKMDSLTHELQASIQFGNTFMDVLVFISPVVLSVGTKEYSEAVKACNFINRWVKGFGRFYVDEYGDVVYALRFQYDFLERETALVVQEIETAIDFYADLWVPLLDICQGQTRFTEMQTYLNNIWNIAAE